MYDGTSNIIMGDLEILQVDMDGVVANFPKAFNEKYTDKMQFPQATHRFFADLQPMQGAISAITELESHYDVRILTSPSLPNLLCWTDKAEWIRKYFGEVMLEKLTITSYKKDVFGHYLIDDNIHEGFKGKHIHFGTDQFPDWDSILNYLIK